MHLYTNVKKFYNSYVTCIKSKPQCYKLYGILKQLLIPKQSWNLISIDFIKKLSFLFSCNTILVIIDQLSKQAIFILTVNTITSYELAKLFVIHVFFKNSILFHITFNCRTKFVSNFFRFLEIVLNIRLYFISRYHPKEDGQIEHTNQTLE